jgi:hypothetical protein
MPGTLNQIGLKNQYGEQSKNQIVAGAHGLIMTSPGGGGIYMNAGAPSFSAPAGSLYIRNDGTSSTCLYVNATVGNNWAAITVP